MIQGDLQLLLLVKGHQRIGHLKVLLEPSKQQIAFKFPLIVVWEQICDHINRGIDVL